MRKYKFGKEFLPTSSPSPLNPRTLTPRADARDARSRRPTLSSPRCCCPPSCPSSPRSRRSSEPQPVPHLASSRITGRPTASSLHSESTNHVLPPLQLILHLTTPTLPLPILESHMRRMRASYPLPSGLPAAAYPPAGLDPLWKLHFTWTQQACISGQSMGSSQPLFASHDATRHASLVRRTHHRPFTPASHAPERRHWRHGRRRLRCLAPGEHATAPPATGPRSPPPAHPAPNRPPKTPRPSCFRA